MLKEEVDEEDVAEIVAKWTGIPVSRLMEGELAKLVRLEEVLHERVIGQDDRGDRGRRTRSAVRAPASPIRTGRSARSCSSARPVSARPSSRATLAEFLFDDERAMVRIDMSEYMEKHSVSRLVGAPPGYVGYEEGGQLTEAVRRRPYAVILLDEIEKAHPDVFNMLLQLMDDGRLTDGQGRTVDFTNAVVIMTQQPRRGRRRGPGDGRGAQPLQARVPQPGRRDRRVPPACRRSDIARIVDIQVEQLADAAGGDAGSGSTHRRGTRARIAQGRATTPTSARVRSSACSSARSPTRSRSTC